MKKSYLQNKTKKNSNRIYISGFILLISIGLFYSDYIANEQDKLLLNDYSLYQNSVKSIEGGNTEAGIEPLIELSLKYNKEYDIIYKLGFSYLNMGKFESALPLYQKSIDLNPYLVENTGFMYQFAIILYNNEQYDNTLLVLDRLLTYQLDEAMILKVNELKDATNSLKGTTT